MQEREWKPAAIVEEKGDRGAMKQMQSHGIPLKPTTVLRELGRERPRNFADPSVKHSGCDETHLRLFDIQRHSEQSI